VQQTKVDIMPLFHGLCHVEENIQKSNIHKASDIHLKKKVKLEVSTWKVYMFILERYYTSQGYINVASKLNAKLHHIQPVSSEYENTKTKKSLKRYRLLSNVFGCKLYCEK
jgi:hypothetical protein